MFMHAAKPVPSQSALASGKRTEQAGFHEEHSSRRLQWL